ncbi:MAG TPA: [Fe-Fe] hydrogenase large subunit C-terminal domain-containing protein [Gemmatimonadaceae bacterium]|jgi:hypothetical protein|nr:[Fe-Fe] hydrogenase large subunit C-terminal domain-containing protein [Gemmatimonadaceae bacterium]
MTSPPHPEQRPSSVAILGTDAILAALPASAVQLAHACGALGYDMVFPGSWGDEIVARQCLERLGPHSGTPAILAACPHVVQRLTKSGSDLCPWLLELAAPPVAVARYIRAAYGDRPIHITYIGACPAGIDASIDARISPAELFASFAERDITPAAQPAFFEAFLPPDRRRYYSLPGGAPAPERLAELQPPRELVELAGGDLLIELAQRLLTQPDVLIDPAPYLGCVCSGVLTAGAAHGARTAFAALEPPRANGPVVEHTLLQMAEPTLLGSREAAPHVSSDAAKDSPAEQSAPHPRSARPKQAPVMRIGGERAIPRAYARFRQRTATRTEAREALAEPAPPPPVSPPPPFDVLPEFSGVT